MLPSWAYRIKACSPKWKLGPQNKYRESQDCVIDSLDNGLPVVVAIGYDAGPKDSKRRTGIEPEPNYEYIYPLVELGWDRDRCIEEIRKECLPGFETDRGGRWVKKGGVPVKSACWFCPSTKPDELEDFSETQHGRNYLRAIIRMEANAAPNLDKIEGLWGNGVKGTRNGRPKPGRMTDYILDKGLLGNKRVALPVIQENYEFDGPEECSGYNCH
jgi:hypothetical protein